MKQTFVITGRLPTLNKMLDANGESPHVYNALKKEAHELVERHLPKKFPAFKSAHFTYEFFEPTKRFDPSNFTAGAVKCIEDALQHAGVIENDGWKHVLSITTKYTSYPGAFPRVKVTLEGETDDRRPEEIRAEKRKARAEKAKERAEPAGKPRKAVRPAAKRRRKKKVR